MSNSINPIPTLYKNYYFRSRAEARWAVFFDALDIKYLYEPEGFELNDGTRYLPDFYLPESDTFFEVKGIMTDKDMHKIESLISDLNKPCCIGYSDMTFNSCNNMWNEYYYLAKKEASVLVRCSECGKYYFAGLDGSFECKCCGAYDGDHYFDTRASGDHCYWLEDEVLDAIKKANQARFEYGEKCNNLKE